MAERLARIAGVSLKDIGHELYAPAARDGKSAEELFRADYKQFHIAEQNIGVSQITCVDADHLLRRRGEFLALMTKLKEKQEFDMVILMITDVLQEGSHISMSAATTSCAGLQQGAARQLPLPRGRHEPQKADHPLAHRPLGLTRLRLEAEGCAPDYGKRAETYKQKTRGAAPRGFALRYVGCALSI